MRRFAPELTLALDWSARSQDELIRIGQEAELQHHYGNVYRTLLQEVDPTYQDFLSFLRQRIEENQTLEYKPRGLLVYKDDSIVPDSASGRGFLTLAKIVASFANAEGGLLVLGVKERPESFKGVKQRILPGSVSAIPLNVTREIIENQLLAKIQYPIDNLLIVPLRSSTRSKHFVYLIDVPQSSRAPHRVNERYYYQRYNFSTIEMKHYQIADIFGKDLRQY